ncbi:hypothetical protein [Shewanella xiamenensis]|uniref:hypothetical protein n=1 Tax=Shewanella xiamenensis TaxID=332186 RepID=UPI0021799A11|nr:hypothetical protein [Shewanella xiamenensis]BDQ68660.1 hypothetical protein NUITMVS2_44730 [Shewanella xiamenensis]GLD78902.1 hypothetical protein NUITMVS3_33360 [Shewanella xiamenensis]
MTKLILILALIVFLLWFLQKLPQTKLKERPINLLANGFTHARLDLAARFLAHSICITAPLVFINLLPIAEMFSYTVAFVTLALLIPPELVIDDNSELITTKKLFSNGADIHLHNPYQHFTMRTYKELLFLVETLPNYGVRNIKLTSPMFYHPDGTLRDFSTLEKLLAKKNSILSSYEAKPWQNLLGKISMMIDSAKDKKEKLRNINLNKWHVLTIKMEG